MSCIALVMPPCDKCPFAWYFQGLFWISEMTENRFLNKRQQRERFTETGVEISAGGCITAKQIALVLSSVFFFFLHWMLMSPPASRESQQDLFALKWKQIHLQNMHACGTRSKLAPENAKAIFGGLLRWSSLQNMRPQGEVRYRSKSALFVYFAVIWKVSCS